jgi:hypothetical protein
MENKNHCGWLSGCKEIRSIDGFCAKHSLSLYEAIKHGKLETVKELERKAEAGQIIRII